MKPRVALSKVVAVIFSMSLMAGYVVYRTARAGEADSRVLPSSKLGRVTIQSSSHSQQQPSLSFSPGTQPTGYLTIMELPATQPSFQLAPQSVQQRAVFSGSKSSVILSPSDPAFQVQTRSRTVFPGSKSAAVVGPGDPVIQVLSGSSAPATQPANPTAPTTRFSLQQP